MVLLLLLPLAEIVLACVSSHATSQTDSWQGNAGWSFLFVRSVSQWRWITKCKFDDASLVSNQFELLNLVNGTSAFFAAHRPDYVWIYSVSMQANSNFVCTGLYVLYMRLHSLKTTLERARKMYTQKLNTYISDSHYVFMKLSKCINCN